MGQLGFCWKSFCGTSNCCAAKCVKEIKVSSTSDTKQDTLFEGLPKLITSFVTDTVTVIVVVTTITTFVTNVIEVPVDTLCHSCYGYRDRHLFSGCPTRLL
jgi:hypothetical protein